MFRPLVLLVLCGTAFAALPKGWKACKQSDPAYSECLSSAISGAISTLVDGNKKLKVLPIDPLKIEVLKIGKGSGPVAIELTLSNAEIDGIKNIQIKNVRNDWKIMDIEVLIPRLEVISDYKINGKVLVLPITGQGKSNITFDQLTIKAQFIWKEVTKNDVKYINMESLKIPLEPKRIYFKLENLFNGDKALGDNMNKFLNENWEAILNELREPISKALEVAFLQISNQVMDKIPASDIVK